MRSPGLRGRRAPEPRPRLWTSTTSGARSATAAASRRSLRPGPARRPRAAGGCAGGRAAARARPPAHRARLRAAPRARSRRGPRDARRRDARPPDRSPRRRRLPVADVALLGLQLCSAIGYLHGQGFLHLDLKPSNVIVDGGPGEADRPEPRAPAGAGAARASGRARTSRPSRPAAGVTAATDVWGIGATLYEAASGTRPFPDARPKLYPQRERRAPSVAESRRAPSRFTEIVDACLSLEPSGRPSVTELADELDAVIGP